jgi:thioester reductase-like protein
MDSVNVDAVKHLIDFSLRRDCDFVQISTLSAAVGRVGKVDEQMFCELPTGAVPYVASKWKAEQLVFGAVENGLKLKLIRLGNLSPRSSDGVFQINAGDNAAMNLLNVVRRLGCYPKSLDGQLLDFTPVDNAARDVARLMTVEPSPVVFHVFNPQKVLINDVVDARMVDDSEFARLVEREQLAVQILMKNFAENNGCNWDNEFTISVLKKLYNPQFSRSRLR